MVATSIPQLDTLNIICQNQYPTGSSSMRTASASFSWLRTVSGMSIVYSKWQKIDVTSIFYCLRRGSTCLCQIILLLILTMTLTRLIMAQLPGYEQRQIFPIGLYKVTNCDQEATIIIMESFELFMTLGLQNRIPASNVSSNVIKNFLVD